MGAVKSEGPHTREQAAESEPIGLGTFGGVFTPSILTILGVIMYLRFGWVVGNVGLTGTAVIVTLSTAITLLTALSIAAISTAQKVRIGGAYYMISRSLGIEAGGAVGIPLYFAQALSVALYTIGFAESVTGVFPAADEKMVALLTTVAVTLIALKSAKAAIKAQYVIMAAIAFSLVSLLFGTGIPPDPPSAGEVTRESFWVVFAVFFPAVTGIMAGVNMSGDLKEPGRSIPRGTLAAIGVGYIIYMSIPFILDARVTQDQMVRDPLIMRRIAWIGNAIVVGVWGATLSSAVGSILGAPRVLQALARDGVLPPFLRFLGQGSGVEDEPRVGTAFTLMVAVCTVLLADLNMVAPILTMFFLTTYGVLNITAGLEKILGNPSYRPKFTVHWIWSLLGAIGCTAVMFLINTPATVVAIVIVISIYFWLERRELKTAWGDVRRGIWMNLTRAGLLRLRTRPDAKNWRPHLLVLSGAPTKRWHLIEFSAALTHNRALVTVSSVLPEDTITARRLEKMTATIYDYLDRNGIQALVRLVRAPDPFEGSRRLISTYGLGMFVPNTVVLGNTEHPDHFDSYCGLVSHIYAANRNSVVVRYNEVRGFGDRQRIDIWWGGRKGNGALMIILAYLLRTSLDWRGARMTVKMVVPTEEAAGDAAPNLEEIIDSSRTEARSEVIVSGGRDFPEILKESSSSADVLFLGLAEPGDEFASYYEGILRRTSGLPTTLFVLAAENVDFEDVIV